jgi:hypothetical protein
MADQIGDDILRSFSAHRDLPAYLVAQLKDRIRKILKQGDIANARRLARLATRDELAGAVSELMNRRDTLRPDTLRRVLGDYLRPTVDALLWRDPRLRKLLRADPQQAHKLPSYRCAARHESSWRACIVIELLSELAKRTTQPDEWSKGEIDRHRRIFEEERRAWKLLCVDGLADQAEPHFKRAIKHLVLTHILATPDRDELGGKELRNELLLVTWRRLRRHFGFNGYRIAAALVSAALECEKPISRSRARYVIKMFLHRLKNRRAIS